MPISEKFEAAGMTIQFLITGEDTEGSGSVFRATLPAELKMPVVPHSHDTWDEINIGVRGTVTFTVDGKPIEIGAGEVMLIPRGAVHGFANRGSEEAEILSVSTPAHFSPDYFREMTALFNGAGDGPPDRGAMAEIMKSHGLTPAVPAEKR
jgi:quercetin dioxygenase-like cupin family protein